MNKAYKLISVTLIIVACNTMAISFCHGYMKPTHMKLNLSIVDNEYGISLDNYLIQSLNLPDGKNEMFSNGVTKRCFEWLRDGGSSEDEPNLVRNMHHFHDPLVEYWPNAGFKGVGISSAIWAQSLTQNQLTGTGNYSWHDAREYFYNALTASDENIRNANFADCFRGLGQQMHLVQDASVPSHTRDDFHRYYHYEHFVNDNKALVQSIINDPANIPVVDPAIFRMPDYQYTPSPTANLIDNNLYNGNNPEVTTGMNIGLAEYANANFLSEDTIFLDYKYPSISTSVVPVDNYIPDPRNPGNSVHRMYYYKTGDGDSDYPVAAINYFKNYHIRYVPWLDVDKIAYCYDGTLDRVCYQAYATRLLPRAVAYSSELLRYFFRGDVESVDASATQDTDGAITGMTMKVKNATADEGMAGGGLVVSCRYKPADATEYSYTKSAEEAMSPLASGATSDTEYEFSFPDPIPSGATDMQYTLVYRGQLGAEADAVAAKAFEAKPFVLDDWERDDVGWGSQFAGASDSLSGDIHKAGNKSMKVDISETAGEDMLYDVSPPQGSGHPIVDVGYMQYNNCMYVDEFGQSLAIDSGRIVSRMKLFLSNHYRNDPYTATLRPVLYIDNGIAPGVLYKEGDDKIIHDTDLPYYYIAYPAYSYAPVTFTFAGGTYLQDDNQYNISVKAVGFTGVPAWGQPDIMTRYIINEQYRNIFYHDTDCGGPDAGWKQQSKGRLPATIYAVSSSPIASRNIQKDCSAKNNLKFYIKSSLTGNVVDFYYGTDSGNLIREPVSVTGAGSWQAIGVHISGDIDKSQLGHYEFRLGKDSIDYETGKTKPNTIYLDQLEAE